MWYNTEGVSLLGFRARQRSGWPHEEFKPMAIAEPSPCQEPGHACVTSGGGLHRFGGVSFKAQAEAGRGNQTMSFSWSVTSGQVTLVPGWENRHRQKEEG